MNSEITSLLNARESESLDFKGSRASLESIAKDVCGFLNQQGGVVVWGASDDGTVTGVPECVPRAHELNDYLIQNINPRPLLSVSTHTMKEKNLVVVEVPQGADKPYSFRRQIWVRVGSTTLKATTEVASNIVETSAARLDR